jgi:hypothetical protein
MTRLHAHAVQSVFCPGHDNRALQSSHASIRHLAVAQARVAAVLQALGCNRPSRDVISRRGDRRGTGPPPVLFIAKGGGGGALFCLMRQLPLPAVPM